MSTKCDLKCFGRNDAGQLGYGDTNNRGDEPDEMGDDLPFVDLGADFVVEDMFLSFSMACMYDSPFQPRSTNNPIYCVLLVNDKVP